MNTYKVHTIWVNDLGVTRVLVFFPKSKGETPDLFTPPCMRKNFRPSQLPLPLLQDPIGCHPARARWASGEVVTTSRIPEFSTRIPRAHPVEYVPFANPWCASGGSERGWKRSKVEHLKLEFLTLFLPRIFGINLWKDWWRVQILKHKCNFLCHLCWSFVHWSLLRQKVEPRIS